MKKKICIVLLLIFNCPGSFANELRLGIMGEIDFPVYKGVKHDTVAYPFINYDSQRFYIEGDEAGIYFLKTEEQELSLGAGYHWQGLKPSDSTDHQIKLLDKRKESVMLNLDYTYITSYGGLSIELDVDLLRRNKGTTIDLGYIAQFDVGKVTLAPNIGAIWYSKHYNNYYYGISENESVRSGLPRYTSKSGINPYVELNVIYKVTDKWEALLSTRYEHMSHQVKKSPMVKSNGNKLVKFGVLYQF